MEVFSSNATSWEKLSLHIQSKVTASLTQTSLVIFFIVFRVHYLVQYLAMIPL